MAHIPLHGHLQQHPRCIADQFVWRLRAYLLHVRHLVSATYPTILNRLLLTRIPLPGHFSSSIRHQLMQIVANSWADSDFFASLFSESSDNDDNKDYDNDDDDDKQQQ